MLEQPQIKTETLERIASPAILLENGVVITGENHEEMRGQIAADDSLFHLKTEEGFKTSTGRFVSRKEAAEIAFNAKQIQKRTESLNSQMLNSLPQVE